MGDMNLSFSTEALYEIQVMGSFGMRSTDLLGSMKIEVNHVSESKSIYSLKGILRDQAELAGLLNSIFKMHMVVLSVSYLGKEDKPSKSN